MRKFHFDKTSLKTFHILFYIGFFVLYLAVQYFFLYHVNGLNPFSLNIHFFSNVIGSLSKRFLSEVSVYALIFYILFFYAKRWWSRIILVGLFLAFFVSNIMAIAFYFFTRTNFQFYILEGFSWSILFSYFTPKITVIAIFILGFLSVMAYFLFRSRNQDKDVWLLKQRLFLCLLIFLAIGSSFIPIVYSDHVSVMEGDTLQKKFFKIMELEKSGIAVLGDELKYTYSPPDREYQALNDDEKKLVEESNLDTQLIQKSSFHPKKIVLVVVESLNQEFLSRYNPKIPNATPNLDSLFKQYPHIDEFYPSGPYTLHGLSSMLCGHTNGKMVMENVGFSCAPELLSKTGFKNEFIRGATKYYVGENLHFKKFGFDTIFAKEDFEKKFPDFIKTHSSLYGTWGYTDNYVFDEAIERLKQAKPDDKLFLTLLTVDTHVAGGRCYYKKTDSDPQNPLLFSIECFDRVFGEFYDKLKKENLLNDDTAIILTADQLYPAYDSVPGADFQTSFVLKPAKTPFILITPSKIGLKAKSGSQIDIAATLLDFVGIQIPDYFMGKSLISNIYTTPTGQDRENGFMIVDGHFYPLSLNPQLQQYQKTEGPKSFLIQASTEAEIEAIAEQKIAEGERQKNQQSAFFKWYYNKYFGLSG